MILDLECPLPKALTNTERCRFVHRCIVMSILGTAILAAGCLAQSASPSSAQIPVMDGAAGRCSVLLTVLSEGKPVNAADVKVHIEYGFGGFHRLDLEAYTNEAGMLKFTGLPPKVRRPPLEFRATKDQLSGIATWDPANECEGKHDLPLNKAVSAPAPTP